MIRLVFKSTPILDAAKTLASARISYGMGCRQNAYEIAVKVTGKRLRDQAIVALISGELAFETLDTGVAVVVDNHLCGEPTGRCPYSRVNAPETGYYVLRPGDELETRAIFTLNEKGEIVFSREGDDDEPYQFWDDEREVWHEVQFLPDGKGYYVVLKEDL